MSTLDRDATANIFTNIESKSPQQLEMLKHMRKFNLDDQSAILEKVTTSFQITSTFYFLLELWIIQCTEICLFGCCHLISHYCMVFDYGP